MITIQEVHRAVIHGFAQCVYNTGVSRHINNLFIGEDGCAYITRVDKTITDDIELKTVKLTGDLHSTILETCHNDLKVVEEFMKNFTEVLEKVRTGELDPEEAGVWIAPIQEEVYEDE